MSHKDAPIVIAKFPCCIQLCERLVHWNEDSSSKESAQDAYDDDCKDL
jgi:hypothetical protein